MESATTARGGLRSPGTHSAQGWPAAGCPLRATSHAPTHSLSQPVGAIAPHPMWGVRWRRCSSSPRTVLVCVCLGVFPAALGDDWQSLQAAPP